MKHFTSAWILVVLAFSSSAQADKVELKVTEGDTVFSRTLIADGVRITVEGPNRLEMTDFTLKALKEPRDLRIGAKKGELERLNKKLEALGFKVKELYKAGEYATVIAAPTLTLKDFQEVFFLANTVRYFEWSEPGEITVPEKD